MQLSMVNELFLFFIKIYLYFVRKLGHVNIVRMLMAHGAPIYAKTKANQTAALLAVQNGHVEVINELINYEAPDDNDKAVIDQAKLQSKYKTKVQIISMLIINFRR